MCQRPRRCPPAVIYGLLSSDTLATCSCSFRLHFIVLTIRAYEWAVSDTVKIFIFVSNTLFFVRVKNENLHRHSLGLNIAILLWLW